VHGGDGSTEPLLLEIDGMKCGGCVRAVEQRLQQQQGVRQASVSLLNRTAWVDLDPTATTALGGAEVVLAALQERLAGLGFTARPRPGGEAVLSRDQRLRQRSWWQQWRQLLVALALLLISGLGHLADAGQLLGSPAWLPWQRPWLHALVASLALAGPGRGILLQGGRAALAGLPSMDTLVGLGVLSAYGSSLLGWLWPASGWPCFFNEPVMLLGFVLTGRFLEERARWRTGRALEELAALEPDHALLLLDDGPPRQVRVGGLRAGDRISLLPGDRVPVDGVVIGGTSAVDLSSLTGEPLPLRAQAGSELSAGSLNLEAPLVLEVRRSGADSAIARIVHLVEQAQARKAPIQGLADRLAGGFALAVLALALATFLFWWLWGGSHWPGLLAAPVVGHGHGPWATAQPPLSPFGLALQLSIAVLVVACPCALGLATPTAISVGTGLAARSGLLFRGGDAIEAASALRSIVFDKTGTLTLGRPLVEAVELAPSGSGAAAAASPAAAHDRLLQRAASLERQSRHPLAHALLQEAESRGLPLLAVLDSRAEAGDGLLGRLEGVEAPLRVGRLDWLARCGVAVDAAAMARQQALESDGASLVAVAEGGQLLGWVVVRDQPRPDAAATMSQLRGQGYGLALLSGDRRLAVEQLGGQLGLAGEELAWELRPEQKLERILRCHRQGPVAMVGDGINDAPALAAADLGVAIGTGTQIAQDSAGLVVMGDRLAGLPMALAIARCTMARVRQNLAWAFGYNLLVLPIAAGALLPGFGLRLSPPLAALLMACSSITVVVNALLLQQDAERIGRDSQA
jgi:Cu2+-exporting ATPase